MIKTAPYCWIECDACGRSAQEGSDYAAWSDAAQAVDAAANADWIEVEDGDRQVHICYRHNLNPEICNQCDEDLEGTANTITDTEVIQHCPHCHHVHTITLKEKQ